METLIDIVATISVVVLFGSITYLIIITSIFTTYRVIDIQNYMIEKRKDK